MNKVTSIILIMILLLLPALYRRWTRPPQPGEVVEPATVEDSYREWRKYHD